MLGGGAMPDGKIYLEEDVGGAAHNGKIWEYDPAVGLSSLKMIAMHDAARFGNVGVGATSPFTNDEEASGIIDISSIMADSALTQALTFVPGADSTPPAVTAVTDPSAPDGFAIVRNRVGGPLIVDFEKMAALEAPFIRQENEDRQRSIDDFLGRFSFPRG